MSTSRQLGEFIDALHDCVQEPGWMMMKPANPSYLKMQRISALFKDNRDDIKSLCREYLKSDGAIKKDFDLDMKHIVMSEAWQSGVKKYIADLGHFAGDSHALLGTSL